MYLHLGNQVIALQKSVLGVFDMDTATWSHRTRETLECDLAAEQDARALYAEAREYCASVRDYVSKALFDELLADEEGHIDFLETQLGLYDRLGAAGYALLNAAPMTEAE